MYCFALQGENLVLASNSPCTTSQLVVLTKVEIDQLGSSPWNLSLANGGAISAAICLVWVSAFAIRALVRTLNSGDNESI